MAINLAQIRDLLRPGLYAVDGEYERIPTLYKKVFKTKPSTMTVERKTQMAYLGLAQLKNEGGATQFDNAAGQRQVWNAETFEVGLGYAITRKAIRDNLYKSQFKPTALGLANSFREFWEYQAFNVFNNGLTYDTNIGGDGKALFATDHPVDQATWANTFTTQLDLNESSLLQAMLSIRSNWVDERNLKIKGRPRSDGLMIPVALQPVASRLVKTELRPGTANNDINAIRTIDGAVTDYMTIDYLTSSRAWYLLTQNDGFIFWERDAFETDMWVDNITDSLLVKGYQRAQPIYDDPRAAWGSIPTS